MPDTDIIKAAFRSAQACVERGDLVNAVEQYRRALNMYPDHAPSHCNLGNLYRALGKTQSAEQSYRRAIKALPTYALAHHNLALLLLAREDFKRAEVSCLRAIKLDPTYAAAHYTLGLIYVALKDGRRAKQSYREAIALDSQHASALVNLGNLHRDAGELSDARSCFEQALHANKADPDIHSNLGSVLHELGAFAEAEAAFLQALKLNERHVHALANLGSLYRERGDLQKAATLCRQSIQIAPQYARAQSQLARILVELGNLGEALEVYKKALALDNKNAATLAGFVSLRQSLCDWHGLVEDQKKLIDAAKGSAGEIAPIIMLSQPCGEDVHLACARQRSAFIARGIRPLPARDVSSPQRIHVGYLSSDFHEHATAYLAAELFEKHDRTRFRVTGYSYGLNDNSPMRTRLEAAFDSFRDIAAFSHAAAAALIREDKVDILVDLKGHCNGACPQILAHRPAPLQVNFLGYPGSLGANFIDYIVADARTLDEKREKFYDEKIVYLPHCYQPNDTQRFLAQGEIARSDLGLPEQAFVFCCFNNAYKITETLFDIWMRLLRVVPDSVLWLIDSGEPTKANLRREAAARGVDAARLIFAPKVSLDRHLSRHAAADLFLDTLPYNAHTTGSDALWAGVPVVTCAGRSFAGRVGASLLDAIGLEELVTDTLDDYERLARELATTPERLKQIRLKLAANRTRSPLFDISRYARHIEDAYLRIFRNWAGGNSPVTTRISPLG